MKIKTKPCLLLVSLLLAAMSPAALAQPKEFRVLSQPAPATRFETRTVPQPVMGPVEKEEVTYLGVETAPVSETLSSQLGLPKDSGLVVMNLVPESPAAGALKRHDILLKFDDQLLVEPRQFAVLIRNHKDGDEVALTYVRNSKTATAKVKLGKHGVPKLALMGGETFGTANALTVGSDDGLRSRAEMDRVLHLVQRDGQEWRTVETMPAQGFTRVERREGPGLRATQVNPANSNMVFTDEHGSLDLTFKEGQKMLVAKNAKGEQVFAGPVNTPAERGALPPDVRERLDKLEGMQEFTFKTEEGFSPSGKTIRPVPRGIALPSAPTPATGRPRPSPIF